MSSPPLLNEADFQKQIENLDTKTLLYLLAQMKPYIKRDTWAKIISQIESQNTIPAEKELLSKLLFEISSIEGKIQEYTNNVISDFTDALQACPDGENVILENGSSVFNQLAGDFHSLLDELPSSRDTIKKNLKAILEAFPQEMASHPQDIEISRSSLLDIIEKMKDLVASTGKKSGFHAIQGLPVEIGHVTRSFQKHVGNITKLRRNCCPPKEMEPELNIYSSLINLSDYSAVTLKGIKERLANYVNSPGISDSHRLKGNEIASKIDSVLKDPNQIDSLKASVKDFIRLPFDTKITYSQLKSEWTEKYSAAKRIQKMKESITDPAGNAAFKSAFRYEDTRKPDEIVAQYFPPSRPKTEVESKYRIASLLNQIANLQSRSIFPELEDLILASYKLVFWLQFQPYTNNTIAYAAGSNNNLTHKMAWNQILSNWDALTKDLTASFYPEEIINDAFKDNKTKYANRIIRSWTTNFTSLLQKIQKTLRAQLNKTGFKLDSSMAYFPSCDREGKLFLATQKEKKYDFISNREVRRKMAQLDTVARRINQTYSKKKDWNQGDWNDFQTKIKEIHFKKLDEETIFSTQVPKNTTSPTTNSNDSVMDELFNWGVAAFFHQYKDHETSEDTVNTKEDNESEEITAQTPKFQANDLLTILNPFQVIDKSKTAKNAVEDRKKNFQSILETDQNKYGWTKTYLTDLFKNIQDTYETFDDILQKPPDPSSIVRWQRFNAQFCKNWLEKIQTKISTLTYAPYISYYHLEAFYHFWDSVIKIENKIVKMGSKKNEIEIKQCEKQLTEELDALSPPWDLMNIKKPLHKHFTPQGQTLPTQHHLLPGFATPRYNSEFISTGVNQMVQIMQSFWTRFSNICGKVLANFQAISLNEIIDATTSNSSNFSSILTKIQQSQQIRFEMALSALNPTTLARFVNLPEKFKNLTQSFITNLAQPRSVLQGNWKSWNDKYQELLKKIKEYNVLATNNHGSPIQLIPSDLQLLLALDAETIFHAFSIKITNPLHLAELEPYIFDLTQVKEELVQEERKKWLQVDVDKKLGELLPSSQKSQILDIFQKIKTRKKFQEQLNKLKTANQIAENTEKAILTIFDESKEDSKFFDELDLRYRSTSSTSIQWIEDLKTTLTAIRSAKVPLNSPNLSPFLFLDGDPEALQKWNTPEIWIPRLLRVLGSCRQRIIPLPSLNSIIALFIDKSKSPYSEGPLLKEIMIEGAQKFLDAMKTIPVNFKPLIISSEDEQWITDNTVSQDIIRIAKTLDIPSSKTFNLPAYAARICSQICKEEYFMTKYCSAHQNKHPNTTISPHINPILVQRWVRHTLAPYYRLIRDPSHPKGARAEEKYPYKHLVDNQTQKLKISHVPGSLDYLLKQIPEKYSVPVVNFMTDSLLPQFVGHIYQGYIKGKKPLEYHITGKEPTQAELETMFRVRHNTTLNNINKEWLDAWGYFLQLIQDQKWTPSLLLDSTYMDTQETILTKRACEQTDDEEGENKKIKQIKRLMEKWNGKVTRFHTLLGWYNQAQTFNSKPPENLIGFREPLLKFRYNQNSDYQYLIRDSNGRLYIMMIIRNKESAYQRKQAQAQEENKAFWDLFDEIMTDYQDRVATVENWISANITLGEISSQLPANQHLIRDPIKLQESQHKNPSLSVKDFLQNEPSCLINPAEWDKLQQSFVKEPKKLTRPFSQTNWQNQKLNLLRPDMIKKTLKEKENLFTSETWQRLLPYLQIEKEEPTSQTNPIEEEDPGKPCYFFTYQLHSHPHGSNNALKPLISDLTQTLDTLNQAKESIRFESHQNKTFALFRWKEFIPPWKKRKEDLIKILHELKTFSVDPAVHTALLTCIEKITKYSNKDQELIIESGDFPKKFHSLIDDISNELSPFLNQEISAFSDALKNNLDYSLGWPELQCLPNGELRLIQPWSQPSWRVSPLIIPSVIAGDDQGLREHAALHAEFVPQFTKIIYHEVDILYNSEMEKQKLPILNREHSVKTISNALTDLLTHRIEDRLNRFNTLNSSPLKQRAVEIQRERDHAFGRNKLREFNQFKVACKNPVPKAAISHLCLGNRSSAAQKTMYQTVAHRTSRLLCQIGKEIFPPLSPNPLGFTGLSTDDAKIAAACFEKIYPTLIHTVRVRLEALSNVPVYNAGRSKSRKGLAQRSSQWIYALTAKYSHQTAETSGTNLQLVDARYTSQACPACGIIGNKGYLLKIESTSSQSNPNQITITPLKVGENWISNDTALLSTLTPDSSHSLTLFTATKKKIDAQYKKNNQTQNKYWFYNQKGGTAFRCNNPFCEHFGEVLGRDNVGARNIASKNSIRWTINRLDTHFRYLRSPNPNNALPVSKKQPIPLLFLVANWGEAIRKKKILTDLKFLRRQYQAGYSIFDPRVFSFWYRGFELKSQNKWIWQKKMHTIAEFRTITSQDWIKIHSILTDNNLQAELKTTWINGHTDAQFLNLITYIQKGQIPKDNIEIWKRAAELLDESIWPPFD